MSQAKKRVLTACAPCCWRRWLLPMPPNGTSPQMATTPTRARGQLPRTIQRAADLAQPGDVITVHDESTASGSPPRGGEV